VSEQKSNFVHLHVHSEFSLLNATCRIKDLVKRAVKYQMPALALTDLGNCFAAIDFFTTCEANGIKPILGCEIFVAPKDRFERKTHGIKGASYPLVLLCENNTGWQNLIKLVSAGYTEGFYYKPRIDKSLLKEHSEGLIGLSGAISSELPHLINTNQNKAALAAAKEYNDIFGQNNYFIEFQQTQLRDQGKVTEGLKSIAEELNIPMVATNNVFFMDKKDSEALEAVYCVQNQNTLLDEDRQKVYTNEIYFKSPEEMTEAFKAMPEAIENTVKIADRCNVEIDFKTVHLPRFETEDNMTDKEYLRKLTMEGAIKRYGQTLPKEVTDRIEHELKVISDLGYDSYFLIVWDFVRFSAENSIPVGPGRGSAAGSVISYCLGITDLDPLKYDLLFERFLNPERVSMPDIDIDFCYVRRDEVIQYVSNKYSVENVAQIITFGTMLAKGVIRDIGRVLGMPYSDVDAIAKLVPNELGITLEGAIEKEPELKKLIASNRQIAHLFKLCRSLEGLPRHASTHAAGVVISGKKLTANVPLFRTSDGQISTQFTMGALEKINILKFDFLGLRTLTVIYDTLKEIKRYRDIDVNIKTIPIDDVKTYDMLSQAEAIGIFQLESSGMRDILRKLKPDRFEDLIAILALYRPGPIGSGMVDDFIKRKSGAVTFKYDHPLLEPILADTYGIMVYQEQIMKIVSSLAKFSLAQADSLRRAISKKKPEIIELQKKLFVEGCVKNNITAKLADKIFELIMHFAGYGFNKSHSAAYALVSYQTAYLKCNYPVEFMTALLSSERDNTDKVVLYVEECKRMGVDVLPPDINESYPTFSVINDETIRFGIAAVKNVGQAAIENIILHRNRYGHFKTLHEFCEEVDSRAVNRKTIESLIRCGGFDSILPNRAQLVAGLDSAMAHASEMQKDKQSGQLSLFDTASTGMGFNQSIRSLPEVEEWPELTKLQAEKELLGFYVSGHPIQRFEKLFLRYTDVTSESMTKKEEGSEILYGGLLSKIKFTITKKKQERMAIISIEDLNGSVEALVFPRAFEQCGHLLTQDSILFFRGRVDRKEDSPKLIISNIFTPETIANSMTQSVTLSLSQSMSNDESFTAIQQVLGKHAGQTPVYLNMHHEDGSESDMLIDRSLYIAPTQNFIDSIEQLLGTGSVHLQI
jgi:DNA polymerase-3 subunit alpha